MRERILAKKERPKTDGFLSGVLILSLSTVIVKIIGLCYKIPMLSLLGSEGMGYFNAAYELYTLFCTISTAGLPVAMAVMISSSLGKGDKRGNAIFRISMMLFFLLGTVGMLLLLLFAKPFSGFLGEQNAYLCICAIAPTVFFICLSGAFRGYFQGLGSMKQTAVSQVIEAAGKLVLGLIFASIALYLGYSTDKVAASAVCGLTLGTAVSVLYLAVSKCFQRYKTEEQIIKDRSDALSILKELFKTAVPVTLASAVVSITKVIDMTMILRRLQTIGYNSAQAFSAYGSYTTLALPLFSLAPALIASVALPLIPSLSRAVAAGHKKEQNEVTARALKLTMVLSLPIGMGLGLFSEPILKLIFPGQESAIAVAALPLALLGASVPLSCMITVGNAVLQAYGKPTVPIISMAAGSLCKILLAYILIGIPKIGLLGAPVSTFFCDLVINAVNFNRIAKCLPRPISLLAVFWKPFVASLLAVGSAGVVFKIMESKMNPMLVTLLSVSFAALSYLPMLLLLGVFEKEELQTLPVVGRIFRKNREVSPI